jgi:uncharacterized iron-regulated protein
MNLGGSRAGDSATHRATRRAGLFAVAALVATLSLGCAARGTAQQDRGAGRGTDRATDLAAERANAERAHAAAMSSARAVVLRAGDGSVRGWSDLVDAAASADAILIGETHDHPLGLAAGAALFEDVLARRPGAQLALEFLERDQQAAVDDYLAGIIDEPAFMSAAARTVSSYPPGHRAMVEAARATGRPVIAANAPRRYVRLARTEGYDRLSRLTAEQRRLIRLPDAMPTGAYPDNFRAVMAAMGAPRSSGDSGSSAPPPIPTDAAWHARIDAMFRSQVLWDWTMAESVARALPAGAPVVLVIGRFHVEHDGGTVQALRALAPAARVLTIAFVDEPPPATMPSTTTTAPAASSPPRADFVAYVGPTR